MATFTAEVGFSQVQAYLEAYNAWPKYDSVQPESLDAVRISDAGYANKLVARMSPRCLAPVDGFDISSISDEWELFNLSDREFEHACRETTPLVSRLISHKGLAIAVTTKVLHRHRPGFIPIVDSVVAGQLGVGYRPKDAATLSTAMRKLRTLGAPHADALATIKRRLESGGITLSRLRILDILVWAKVLR